jgi:predicted AAA+ superfamily ATPase
LVEPLELRRRRIERRRKICLCDHGLRASWLQEDVPLDPTALGERPDAADLAGPIAESVAGSFLLSLPTLGVFHLPETTSFPEVDFVIVVGDERIPIEIKYRRRIDPIRDTFGLRRFVQEPLHRAPFGILVTLVDGVSIPDPRIVAIPLSSFLLIR